MSLGKKVLPFVFVDIFAAVVLFAALPQGGWWTLARGILALLILWLVTVVINRLDPRGRSSG